MRLIDADVLTKKIESNSWDIDEWELPHEQVSAGLTANAMDRKTVEEMPTVDAVEVVRCKDCIFNHAKDWVDCFNNGMFGRTTDNFCSRGEKK